MNNSLTEVNYPYDDSADVNNEILTRCLKYDFDTFNSKLFTDKFSVVHLNIRSAVTKFDELAAWVSGLQYKPSVLCLSETCYSSHMPPCVLYGYNIINVPRASGIGGGVCIYVRDVF